MCLSPKPARIGMITARQRVGLRAGPKHLKIKNKNKMLLLKTVIFVHTKNRIPHSLFSKNK